MASERHTACDEFHSSQAGLRASERESETVTWRVALIVLGLVAFAEAAGAEDPHALFESRCAACHGEHAGTFARDSLVMAEDGVRGRDNGRPVEAFLLSHRGGLPADDAAQLTEMFRLQLAAGGVYEQRCRICHLRARDLARFTLFVGESGLVGRYTGRDIRAFLGIHGRLEAEEIEPLYDLLLWQAETAIGR